MTKAEGWSLFLRRFYRERMKKTIELAGIPVGITLRYTDALAVLTPFLSDRAPVAEAAVTPEALAAAREIYEPGSTEPYLEYMELCPRLSDALLAFDRAFFHGVAFLWRERAWIFTGASGAGKTTQYVLWKHRYGDEIRMLNGDKPVLAFSQGQIVVHPSPWNGKEAMGQLCSAPLGGIVLLQQGAQNTIRRLTPQEAAGPLFAQFLFSRETVADVLQVAALEQRLLQQVPVWLLSNRGEAASAQLCHDTLMEEIK
mgnify:CR=1 FL=1